MGEGFDRAPCGLLSTTPDGLVAEVNETFLAWTGFERDDLVGKRTFSELLTTGGRIYHETHYAPMLRMQGSAREIALDVRRADGSVLPVLVNASFDGDVVRVALFAATDRRSYERELLRARQRAEESERCAVELARTLQRTLIPPGPPSIPGLAVGAAYRPAGEGAEVGGDFYDAFEVASGDWVVAVGDVRGKGVEAAVVTALARYTIRAAAVRNERPSDVLAHIDEVLRRDPTDRHCTVAVARLRSRADGWTATFACGGHPLPVVAPAGEAPRFCGTTGTLLGVLPNPVFHDTTVALGPGDVLVLYTDGVTEARDAAGAFFDDRGLLAAVDRHRSADDPAAGLVEDALAFQGGVAADDIAVVSVAVPA